jgi:hypothetical protein
LVTCINRKGVMEKTTRSLLSAGIGLLLLLPALALSGQNWSKLKKQGDDFARNGQFLEAGDAYFKAWQDKPEKQELAWQAAVYFGIINEYGRVAESLEPVAHWNQPDKQAGLLYARALKQSGRHEQAIQAYEAYLAALSAADRTQQESKVQREIAGSRLALQGGEASPFRTVWPGRPLNSEFMDFAPALFGEDVLYFSSTRSGMSRLYRSQYKDDKWGKPDMPKSLPADEKNHVANGSFSSDGQRFYYTICAPPSDARKQRARCEIHVMHRRGSGWTAGERLPDYINLKDATATHPASVYLNGLEYLFFTSDRPGGQGGMDIWYATRNAASKDLDYSFPVNAGPRINTPETEQTPFFDARTGTLYFSSDGHLSLGGMDILAIPGPPGSWGTLTHPGRPLNSEADDTYFKLNGEGQAGFLVSNRRIPGQRDHTRVEDLIYVSTRPQSLLVKGKVFDKLSNSALHGARVFVYHTHTGEKVVFQTTLTENGDYQLLIPDGIEVYLVAEKSEYESSALRIRPAESRGSSLIHNFYLIQETMPDEAPVLAGREKPQADPEPAPKANPVAPSPPVTPQPPAPAPPAAVAAAGPQQPLATPTPEQPAQPEQPSGEELASEKSAARKAQERMAPYQNKVRLQDPSGEQAGATRPAASSRPSAPPPTPAEPAAGPKDLAVKPDPAPARKPAAQPERRSSVGVSVREEPSWLAESEAFSGQGLDKRYHGKRVDRRKYQSETEAFAGIYYRVQLEATDRPQPESDRYAALRERGRIETESLDDPALTRMLLGVFRTLEEAQAAQAAAAKSGFTRAFVVRYQDGVRLRRWK